MNLSLNIKTIREAKRLTQNDIAERIGVDGSNYAKQEKRGNKLSIEQLEKIAIALGVSVKELMFGDKEEDYSTLIEKKKNQVQKLIDLNEQYLHTIKVLTGVVEDIKEDSKVLKEKIQVIKTALLNDTALLEKIELLLSSNTLESDNIDDKSIQSYKDTLLICCKELKGIYEDLAKSDE